MGKKGGGRVRIKQMGPKNPSSFNPLQEFMNNSGGTDEEIIPLPPKIIDTSITNIWPLSQSFTMKYKNNSNFVCIWPTYIDGNKSTKEGRRISKNLAVDQPTIEDISEVLQSFNVRHAIQPYKGYPRDVHSRWYNLGRVLYDLEQMREWWCINNYNNNHNNHNNNSSGLEENDDIPDIPDIPELNDDNDDNDNHTTTKNGQQQQQLTQKKCWEIIASKIESMPGRIARKLANKQAMEEQARKEKAKQILASKANSNKTKKNASGGGGGSSKKKGKKK